jgi:hypothetical protein
MAEHERLLASVRTQTVMAAKRARGERLGQVPYGWRVGADGKALVIDAAEQVAIEMVFRRAQEGASLRAIARELDAAGVPPKRASQWQASSFDRPWQVDLETYRLIEDLQRTGKTRREIARELNRRGIPYCRPTNWPAKWSSTCVARILKSRHDHIEPNRSIDDG